MTPEPAAVGCKAQRTADPPQDCDAPFCGCNPAWQDAIAMLQECGWMSPTEVATYAAAQRQEAVKEWVALKKYQQDVLNELGLLGSPTEELRRLVAHLTASEAAREQARKALEHARTLDGYDPDDCPGCEEIRTLLTPGAAAPNA